MDRPHGDQVIPMVYKETFAIRQTSMLYRYVREKMKRIALSWCFGMLCRSPENVVSSGRSTFSLASSQYFAVFIILAMSTLHHMAKTLTVSSSPLFFRAVNGIRYSRTGHQ